MFTNLKFNKARTKNWFKTPFKSLKKVIFSLIWGQKKWLAWLAVILFVFVTLDAWGAPPTKDIEEKPQLFVDKSVEIISADENRIQNPSGNTQNEIGLMGGPSLFASLLSPTAQALVDFSADDQFEDYDLLTFQDNSIISSANPSGTLNFAGFRREILTYIVKQGDVPERIAAGFDINSDTLLWANGLRDGDIIKPGQQLMVLPINGVRVKVGVKDTIDTLAKKYNGDKMEIIAFNNLPLEGTIKAGDYLIVPDGEMPVSTTPRYSVPSSKYAQSTVPVGWLILPTGGRDWGRIHASNGVDIANVCGTPVYAAAGGTVIVSDGVGYNGGYGKYIEIKHPNGVITLYAHSSKLLVSAREQVAQGQLIMLMGTTGRSTGCHLHFEVRGASNPLAGKQRSY